MAGRLVSAARGRIFALIKQTSHANEALVPIFNNSDSNPLDKSSGEGLVTGVGTHLDPTAERFEVTTYTGYPRAFPYPYEQAGCFCHKASCPKLIPLASVWLPFLLW